MAILIWCGDNVILRCKNSILDFLHKEIMSIIEFESIQLPQNIADLLEKMDQDIYGPGGITVDVVEYLKNKNELALFLSLLKNGIQQYEKKYPNVPQDYKDVLWNFHKELLKYGEELEE